MPDYIAFLSGGPCDKRLVEVHAPGSGPPATTTCKGTTYYYSFARSGSTLVYTTVRTPLPGDFGHVRGQRDVFAAFRALTRALTHTIPGELRRVDGARRRIRRAVR